MLWRDGQRHGTPCGYRCRLWIPCGYNTSAPRPCGWGGADDEDDYFGNCPRSTCGRGERQRLGMIMREKV